MNNRTTETPMGMRTVRTVRTNRALAFVASLGAALLLIIGVDHLVASSRASDLCEAFRPGLDGNEVHALIGALPEKSGVVKVRGNPARMLTAPPQAGAMGQEFVQFAVVFKGLLFRTRQCVVSVKAGRVERSHVTDTNAYVILNPVQTVRIQGAPAR